MTQPRPTAPELLEAVRAFLLDDVLPELDGRKRFHARVAANVLEMVERELRDGPAADRAEHDRLAALLGGGGPADGEASAESTAEVLAEVLAKRIRDGGVDIANPDLVDHLRQTAAADVAITNPKWLDRPAGG